MNDLTDDQFFEALSTEDDLGMIVRAHLHIEHWLEKFLFASIPFYEKYKKQINLNFEQKILLCCAMGLTPDIKKPLNAIGTQRNKFAHEPNYKLSVNALREVYKEFTPEHKKQIQDSYRQLALTFNREEKNYNDLPFKLQLDYLFMFLRKKLMLACNQLCDMKAHIKH